MSEIIWDGKGLPPVGAIVKIDIGAKHYEIFRKIEGKNAEIICHSTSSKDDDPIAVFRCIFGDESVYHGLVEGNFLPIKSERDKAIEEMQKIMNRNGYMLNPSVYAEFYDAGYRKLEENKSAQQTQGE